MAKVKLDTFERDQLKKAYNYQCYICGKTKLPKELSIDHVIPPNKRDQAISDELKIKFQIIWLDNPEAIIESY